MPDKKNFKSLADKLDNAIDPIQDVDDYISDQNPDNQGNSDLEKGIKRVCTVRDELLKLAENK